MLLRFIKYITYLRAAAPAADPGKECEEAGEGQRLRTKLHSRWITKVTRLT